MSTLSARTAASDASTEMRTGFSECRLMAGLLRSHYMAGCVLGALHSLNTNEWVMVMMIYEPLW